LGVCARQFLDEGHVPVSNWAGGEGGVQA
jgi:hypothetical protein